MNTHIIYTICWNMIIVLLLPAFVQAQPISLSPDTSIIFDGNTIGDENLAIEDQANAFVTTNLGMIPNSADLTAYHILPNGDRLMAFDISVTLPNSLSTITSRPADILHFDGNNFTRAFDATAVDIPAGIRIDAVTTEKGHLLLSFDTTVNLDNGLIVSDEDLVRRDGASFSLFFDGSAAGINPALDLDAAHCLNNGELLLSFDGSGSVGSPVIYFDDEDILKYDPVSLTWEIAYDASAQENAWSESADINALDFTERLIIDSWLKIDGTADGGKIFFKIAGVELSINTSNGLALEQIAEAMANAINNNLTLSVIGIHAMTVDSTLYTSGALSNITTTDNGLLFEQIGPTDPVSRFINIQLALSKGFQPLFYPLNDPAINTAFELLSQLAALGLEISEIQGLDQHSSIFHSAYIDLDSQNKTGDDFVLTENQAVLARIKTDKTLSISGAVNCHSIGLYAGVNIIGFNCLENNYSAFQLLTAIGDQNVISSIQKFNPVTGSFETATYQEGNASGSDFAIKIGEAYFIHMLTDVTALNLLNIEKSVSPDF